MGDKAEDDRFIALVQVSSFRPEEGFTLGGMSTMHSCHL